MDKPNVQLATVLRFVVSYQGEERAQTVHKSEAILGRSSADATVDLDLASDVNVSRRHARIWHSDGAHWIEDLGSKGGTLVNGIEIKNTGKRPLPPVGAIVSVGNTSVKVEIPSDPVLSFALLPASGQPDGILETSLSADLPAENLVPSDSIAALKQIMRVLELPMVFLAVSGLPELLCSIMEHTVEVIPADSGALLLNNRNNHGLHLSAFFNKPATSEVLAARALDERKAFAWHGTENGNPISSLYAPLLWEDKKAGVLCLNKRGGAFGPGDLHTLIVIARFAACAVAKALAH